jgi:transcriptional regulator with XRE-family HTH domain
MTVGDKILNLRKARGWSQEELAEQVGVTRQAVSRWESNAAKPDTDKIVDICDLFGVSADYLLRDKYAGEGEPQPTSEAPAVPAKATGVTALQILGILMIISSILVFCALGIMSAINPHLYCADGVDYRGILGYIMGNQLWWLVNIDCANLFAGMLLLIGIPPLRHLLRLICRKFAKNDTQAAPPASDISSKGISK